MAERSHTSLRLERWTMSELGGVKVCRLPLPPIWLSRQKESTFCCFGPGCGAGREQPSCSQLVAGNGVSHALRGRALHAQTHHHSF